jgi:hypothetical protein
MNIFKKLTDAQDKEVYWDKKVYQDKLFYHLFSFKII